MPTFKFKDYDVFYDVKGQGKPILILNGIMMSTGSYNTFVNSVSASNMLVRVDFFDQGQSERLEGIPGWMVIENKDLQEALQKLSDRNLCVFWNHVVEKESLANIARDLELPYDTVTAIYYRTLKSIKEVMMNNG